MAALLSRLYLVLPGRTFELAVVLGAALLAGGIVGYLLRRPMARRTVWPTPVEGTT
jgi:hypothetical protein